MSVGDAPQSFWARFSGQSGAVSIADARALLQRRVALYFQLQFAVAALAYTVRAVRGSAAHEGGLLGLLATKTGEMIGHGSFVVLFALVAVYCAHGERSAALLHALEATGTVFICATYGLVLLTPEVLPQIVAGSHEGWHKFLVVVMTLVLRAALVPSSATRSAVIGALGFLPIVLAFAWASAQRAAPPAAESVFHLEGPPELMAAMWGLTFVIVTAVISRTIYGLQQRVREAMKLGQYTLEHKLGEGGMGAVYRARHALLRRPTAIKLLPADKVGERAIERFVQEVQHTSRLTHPNTVAIYDYGHSPDGIFYYAMEYLEGFDLEQLVALDGPQSPGRVIHILAQVADALSEAHREGLIHRDIKPGNIVLTNRGGVADLVKVVDFGLVKELDPPKDVSKTAQNMFVGTPSYAAPEMITGSERVDGRADLYALGAVGYFLLTAKPVFDGESVIEVLGAHVHQPPLPVSQRRGEPVPEPLEELLLRCLAKQPDDRPADAGALRDALRRCEAAPTWSRSEAAAWWDEHAADVERVRAAHLPTEQAGDGPSALTLALARRSDHGPTS